MTLSTLEEYLFDLRGYLVLKEAVDPQHLDKLNAIADSYRDLGPGQWRGNVYHRPDIDPTDLHNIFEMGEPFELLINHPAWLDHVIRFVGGDDGLFIDESFVDLRGPGVAIHLHSGGHKRRIRTQYRFHDNQFRCGQINILLALNNIGPGDGATSVIPGSHKSNVIHPALKATDEAGVRCRLDGLEEAVEVHLQAGDAVCFVDSISHGSRKRINEGDRRMLVIRYGPHWGTDRYGFRPSPELLARLSPERRRILEPIPPKLPTCID